MQTIEKHFYISYVIVILGIVVDQNQALRFALDIARGMEFLHTMEPLIPNLTLSSKHVMASIFVLFPTLQKYCFLC